LLTDGDPQTLVNCLTNLSMNGHPDGTLLGSWREAGGFVQGQEPCGDNGHMLQHQVCASYSTIASDLLLLQSQTGGSQDK
jgi:hypothetical protein